MDASFVRICTVPALPPKAVDGLSEAVSSGPPTALVRADRDLNCTLLEWQVGGAVEPALRGITAAFGSDRRAPLLSIEVQEVGAADAARESALCALLAESLDAPVYRARREVPASAWAAQRPISFGVDGFAIRAIEATIKRPRSRAPGVSLEFGAPTLLLKVGLHGVPPSALRRLCDAVGSDRGGLLHLGAYPAISSATGDPLVLLECSDPVKSPLARGIELLGIEASRYGGAVGETALLSHMPLTALLGTLAVRMQLPVDAAQIIETHVTGS